MTPDSRPTLLGALWRYRTMAGAIVAFVVALSIAVGLLVAGSVTASATIALTTPPPDAVITSGVQSDASLARFTTQRARFVTSDAVMEEVALALDRSDVTELRDRVTATPAGTSNAVILRVEGDSAGEAVALAEAVIEAYRAQSATEVEELTAAAVAAVQATEAEVLDALGDEPSAEVVSATFDTVGQLRVRIADLLTTQAVYGDGVQFVNEPRRDAVEEPGVPIREGALGVVLGLVLAGTAAWLRADTNAGVDDADDLEAMLEVPTLGTLRSRADVQLLSPVRLDAAPSHDYRLVWTALLRRVSSGVVVVASEGVDARSVAALNIAAAAARDGRSVLLVDADLSTSQISYALADEPGRGLRDVFAGADWTNATHRPDGSTLSQLTLLTAGSADIDDTSVSTEVVQAQVDAWREAHDLVIVDTGDVSSSPVSATLYGAADAVLLVVGRGTTARRIDDLRRRVGLQGSEIVGAIFADVP